MVLSITAFAIYRREQIGFLPACSYSAPTPKQLSVHATLFGQKGMVGRSYDFIFMTLNKQTHIATSTTKKKKKVDAVRAGED